MSQTAKSLFQSLTPLIPRCHLPKNIPGKYAIFFKRPPPPKKKHQRENKPKGFKLTEHNFQVCISFLVLRWIRLLTTIQSGHLVCGILFILTLREKVYLIILQLSWLKKIKTDTEKQKLIHEKCSKIKHVRSKSKISFLFCLACSVWRKISYRFFSFLIKQLYVCVDRWLVAPCCATLLEAL